MRWIPIDIIQFILAERKAKAFQVYVLMNHTTSGYFKADESTMKYIMNICKIKSKKTINKYLEDLIELGFLGHHQSIYYIRSVRNLTSRAKYSVEYYHGFNKNWKAYLCGAFIGFLALHQQIRLQAERHKRGEARMFKKAHSNQLPPSFPVSLKSIATILNMSKANALNIKNLANPYIKIVRKKPTYMNLPIESLKYSNMSNLFQIGNKVYQQPPDEVIPLLIYKKRIRKKSVPYNQP